MLRWLLPVIACAVLCFISDVILADMKRKQALARTQFAVENMRKAEQAGE